MDYKISPHTGAEREFPYKYIQQNVSEVEVAGYCSSIRKQFAIEQTSRWSSEKQTEWLTRHYLAIKMIMSATLLITSRDFAALKNLRIVEPYLLYYSCVCSCKSLIFTLPNLDWEQDRLAQMSHAKVINVCTNALSRLSTRVGSAAYDLLQKAKAYREMFSYRFPGLGLRACAEYPLAPKDIVEFCSFTCEVAQVNSECLESSIRKNVKGEYEPAGDVIEASFAYPFLDDVLEDDDDYYRIAYYLRHGKKPGNLLDMATEGMIEDYFGAWVAKSAGRDLYNPDANIQIIFPFFEG